MSMDKRAYWIWLQRAFGQGSPKPARIARDYESPAAFYAGGPTLWQSVGYIREKEQQALAGYTPSQGETVLESAEEADLTVLTFGAEEYPAVLRSLDDPPAVLYIKGELPDFDEVLGIAVVGSRQADAGSLRSAELISYELSKGGAVVVSGGALGIDAAAHRGAMRGTTPTVCVLACGVDYPYLLENNMLRQRIVERGGALVTEYPPGTGVNKGTFAVRNRIISGLSKGLLAVCGSEKSGTMLTVAHATRQNRDVFAIPGSLENPLAQGPNLLIRDGAKPVLSAADILREYEGLYTRTARPVGDKACKAAVENVSPNARLVSGFLTQEPRHLSELMACTGLRASQVQTAAAELELRGMLVSYSGQRFGLCGK